MKYSQAKQGRIFVIRLEDGDILHEEIERLAAAQGIRAGALLAVGGADTGSTLVVGPDKGRVKPIVPLEHVLDDVHEVAGVGTLFPDDTGKPVLHMHGAFGRKETTVTGCVRTGVRVWHVLEVILIELTDTAASRLPDEATGFKLLQP
ncbi:MAG: DNA-binding protein [Syntrophaceae bacterium]|nr:DNA-binding protein [Syntrophaceae bacterium]